MYHKILDEAILELKESKFKDLFNNELAESTKVLVKDCVIETDLEILIPEDYVSNISERLSLYSQLDNIKEEEDLTLFKQSLTDRFGILPESVVELIESVKLRWLAQKLGFEKLVLKNETLKGYFVSQENESYYKSETFGNLLNYVQANERSCRMTEKKDKLLLIITEVLNVNDAENHLKGAFEGLLNTH